MQKQVKSGKHGIKKIIKNIRTKVFTGVKLTTEELEFLGLVWDQETKFYKEMFKRTWDVKLVDFVMNEHFSPENFYIRESLIKKNIKGSFDWVADEVKDVHIEILMNRASIDDNVTIFKSNKMKIKINPKKRHVTLTQKFDDGTKGTFTRPYRLDELPIFRNIVDQMVPNLVEG